MSFIERIGQKRVGFYCWKLFIINYFRGYEVSIWLISIFLKLFYNVFSTDRFDNSCISVENYRNVEKWFKSNAWSKLEIIKTLDMNTNVRKVWFMFKNIDNTLIDANIYLYKVKIIWGGRTSVFLFVKA